MKKRLLLIFTVIVLFICGVSCENKINTDSSGSIQTNYNTDTSYAEILSSSELLDIQIDISDESWNDMIKKAEEKKYYYRQHIK